MGVAEKRWKHKIHIQSNRTTRLGMFRVFKMFEVASRKLSGTYQHGWETAKAVVAKVSQMGQPWHNIRAPGELSSRQRVYEGAYLLRGVKLLFGTSVGHL